MGRAPCCDKANVKKGPWSPEEDKQLKEYIEKHGTGGNWIALPRKAGLRRCGKSCRLRWLNYLRPNIKHGDFSDDEDRIICSLFASIGSRWSIIAAQLPGRTDNDIKNYWNTKLKKKLLGLPPSYRKPNRHHHQQQKQQQPQLFLPSRYSFEAAAPLMIPSSSSPSSSVAADLEGIPLSSPFNHLLNPNFMATASSQALKQELSSGNLIMFGGDQQQQQIMSCNNNSSSEHVRFDNCIHGGLSMESTEKLMMIHGYGINNTNNLEEVNASAAAAVAVAAAAMDMSLMCRNLERAMYHC